MDTPQTIVNQLRECGLSDAEIADKVTSSQPTIWRIRKAKSADCGGSLYRSLLALRDELVGINQKQDAA